MENGDPSDEVVPTALPEADLRPAAAADPLDVDGDSPAWTQARRALVRRDLDELDAMIRADARVLKLRDSFGQTLLHVAVDMEADSALQNDRPMRGDLTRFLVERGADPHALDDQGESPLDWARGYEHVEAIELMLND
jgi:ankyrin repeat protein